MFVHTQRLRAVPILAGLALVGAACGSSAGAVEASGAWARTSPAMADSGAAYMVLTSDETITLVSVSDPAEVAGRAEIHEVVPVGDSMGDSMSNDDDSMSDDGMDHDEAMSDESMSDDMDHEGDMAMTMQEISSLEIPAGGSVAFEPGGYHVMLLDLPDPLETGETFEVTFTQDDGSEFSVEVEVRDDAP